EDLLESYRPQIGRLDRVILLVVGEGIFLQLDGCAVDRMVGTIHHLNRHSSPPFEAEVVGYVWSNWLSSRQEDCVPCYSAGDWISHRDCVRARWEDLGEFKETVAVRADGDVRQGAPGSDLDAGSGRRCSIWQEYSSGENTGNRIHQLQIEVYGLAIRN